MTKDYVLAILKRSSVYVSGEEISKTIGISRAAVNKAVSSLRSDGYNIVSCTNKGYLLTDSPNKLSAGEILSFLPNEYSKRITFLDSVDSTNSYLQRNQLALSNGDIVIANQQTGGRGRKGRSFESPKDKGIFISMLMRPDCPPSEISEITAWVAVCVSDAIEKVCKIRPGIKWVNDLILGGKKICGILTEMSVEGESGQIQSVITGIGVNVSQDTDDFSDSVRHIASSLTLETGKNISRAQLAAEIAEALDRLRSDYPQKRDLYLKKYTDSCVNIGKTVRIIRNNNEITATATGIDRNFGLIITHDDGHAESITSGEVSVRGLYGYI